MQLKPVETIVNKGNKGGKGGWLGKQVGGWEKFCGILTSSEAVLVV